MPWARSAEPGCLWATSNRSTNSHSASLLRSPIEIRTEWKSSGLWKSLQCQRLLLWRTQHSQKTHGAASGTLIYQLIPLLFLTKPGIFGGVLTFLLLFGLFMQFFWQILLLGRTHQSKKKQWCNIWSAHLSIDNFFEWEINESGPVQIYFTGLCKQWFFFHENKKVLSEHFSKEMKLVLIYW